MSEPAVFSKKAGRDALFALDAGVVRDTGPTPLPLE